MSFTNVTVTGNILQALPSTGITNGTITFTLSNAITDGSTLLAPVPVTASCDSSGNFSVTLAANDDTTTTPVGTYYKVQISYQTQIVGLPGASGSVEFNVVVPRADAPSVDLFALAQLPNPPVVAAPVVSQLVAGTGITLSPSSGTGQVTVSGSGATVVSLGNVSGTVVCDLSKGVGFTATLTGNTTINFSNWPAAPALTEPLLVLTQDTVGGHTITVTGVVWEPSGTPPIFNTAAGSVNVIPLSSPDQGAHLYGSTGPDVVDPIGATKALTPFVGYTVNAGTWGFGLNSGKLFAGSLVNTSQASGDSMSMSIELTAGTWTLSAILHQSAAAGIATFELNGTQIGTWDGYASAAVFNVVHAITGIAVATTGAQTLTMLSNTKNASSTAYAMSVSQFVFQRTA